MTDHGKLTAPGASLVDAREQLEAMLAWRKLVAFADGVSPRFVPPTQDEAREIVAAVREALNGS